MVRYKTTRLALLLSCLLFCLTPLVGCDQGAKEAEGPELGEIEAYLQEHPEERADDPDEAQDEGSEMDASEG